MNVLASEDLKLLTNGTQFHDDYVSYKDVKEFKENLLKKSFENFQNLKNHKEILDKFHADQSFWIDDFILFMIIFLYLFVPFEINPFAADHNHKLRGKEGKALVGVCR